jgi:hypothetical protein
LAGTPEEWLRAARQGQAEQVKTRRFGVGISITADARSVTQITAAAGWHRRAQAVTNLST